MVVYYCNIKCKCTLYEVKNVSNKFKCINKKKQFRFVIMNMCMKNVLPGVILRSWVESSPVTCFYIYSIIYSPRLIFQKWHLHLVFQYRNLNSDSAFHFVIITPAEGVFLLLLLGQRHVWHFGNGNLLSGFVSGC